MKKVAGMKILPEEGELFPIVIRSVVLAFVAYFATGRAETVEVQAKTDLKVEETIEERDGAWRNYGDYIREVEVERAKCDVALEAFARHRDDDHDWAHALEACHSEGGTHDHPAEDPNQ